MGIQNFFKIFEKYAETTTWQKISGTKIAIDASIFIYRAILGMPHVTELTDNGGNITSHINAIVNLYVKCKKYNVTPIFVFDTKAAEQKQTVLAQRHALRESAKLEASALSAQIAKYEQTPLHKPSAMEFMRLLTDTDVETLDVPTTAAAIPVFYHGVSIDTICDQTSQVSRMLARTCVTSDLERAIVFAIQFDMQNIRFVGDGSETLTNLEFIAEKPRDHAIIIYVIQQYCEYVSVNNTDVVLTEDVPTICGFRCESWRELYDNAQTAEWPEYLAQISRTIASKAEMLDANTLPDDVLPTGLITDEAYISLIQQQAEIEGENTNQLELLRQKLASKEKQSFSMRNEVDDAKQLLKLLGIAFIHASDGYEAEHLAAQLTIDRVTDAAVTSDADALIFGATRVIRMLPKNRLQQFELDKILSAEQINREQLATIAVALGSDFAEKTRGIGVKTYKKILVKQALTAQQNAAKAMFLTQCPYDAQDFVREPVRIIDAINWLVDEKRFNRERLEKMLLGTKN